MFSMNMTVDNNGASPGPIPVGQTASIAQTLPREFASQLSHFGSCPESSYSGAATAPGGADDPSVSCPANSLVGTGSLKLIAQAGPQVISATSEKVVIVNDSTNGGLAFWVSYKVIGMQISKIIPGTLSTNGSGQTVITWDPSSVQPTAPIAVKLLEFNTGYNANQSSLQTLEPFANTGCAAGSWAFSVANSFVGGSPATETASASVACGAAAASAAPPVSTAAPTIKGSARVGTKLTESDGTWTGNPAPTLTRQWNRCNGAGNKCSKIAGATGSSYTVRSQDVGQTIRVVVTAVNASGSVSATSAQTAVVPGGSAAIKSKTVTVSAKGKGQVKLACGGRGPCAGSYEMLAAGNGKGKGKKVVLARGRFSVAAGKSGKLSFQLTGRGKALLRNRDGNLGASLKLKPAQGKATSTRLALKSA
jgi:hypothetical protein